MNIDLYKTLKEFEYTRNSGSKEELQTANKIREKISGESSLQEFKVSIFDSRDVILKSDDKEYEVSAINASGSNVDIKAPFYYMETTLDIDKKELNKKIVLINGLITKDIYEKLIKNSASAFISFSGDIIDDPSLTDLEIKELREPLRRLGVIPGVHMRAKTAMELVRDNPQTLKLSFKQTTKEVISNNIIAEIKGNTFSNEVIVITAHYDSVMYSKGVYDNASGSVLILKLYNYFLANPPKRTVRFIWCGYEERGLLGSKAYVNSLTEEELDKIILNINVDVAGSILGIDECIVTAEDKLANYLEYISKEEGLIVKVVQDIYSSDSIPFADKKIPAINLCRFGVRGTAHIHTRYDNMSFISEKSLNNTYKILEHISNRLINAYSFPVKKEISEEIIKKIDQYLYKNR